MDTQTVTNTERQPTSENARDRFIRKTRELSPRKPTWINAGTACGRSWPSFGRPRHDRRLEKMARLRAPTAAPRTCFL